MKFYYTPRLLTEQSFIFDPEQMMAWWEEGFRLFQELKPQAYDLEPAGMQDNV